MICCKHINLRHLDTITFEYKYQVSIYRTLFTLYICVCIYIYILHGFLELRGQFSQLYYSPFVAIHSHTFSSYTLRLKQQTSRVRGDHTPLRFITTCDNGVFIHLSIYLRPIYRYKYTLTFFSTLHLFLII
jgi:hypothetical protein